MNKELLKNDAGEIGPDENRVSRLLSAMKRVDAPKDFDFRVRARIATGRPATRPAFGLPAAIRYAIPLVLLVLIGVYFGFNAFYADKYVDVPVVAEAPIFSTVIEPPSNDGIVTPSNVGGEHAAVKRPENLTIGPVVPPARKAPSTVLPTNRTGGGSFDEAGREERKIYRGGFDPTSGSSANAKSIDHNVPIPAKDVLNLFGMNGTFGESGWKVESVTPDSLAGRSGVKSGDVIEAINDQALTEKTSFKGKFNGRTLRVRRDGASVQIVLKY